VTDKWEEVSVTKYSHDGTMSRDFSMYNGSAGVLLALFKYSKLLAKETDYKLPNWLELSISVAIKKSLESVPKPTKEEAK
jgi:hypothetical protein